MRTIEVNHSDGEIMKTVFLTVSLFLEMHIIIIHV